MRVVSVAARGRFRRVHATGLVPIVPASRLRATSLLVMVGVSR